MIRRLRQPSIRTLVALTVVLPIVVVSGALVALSAATSRHIAEDLGAALVQSATERVRGEVVSYLSSAVRVGDAYARRLADGTLPAGTARGGAPSALSAIPSSTSSSPTTVPLPADRLANLPLNAWERPMFQD